MPKYCCYLLHSLHSISIVFLNIKNRNVLNLQYTKILNNFLSNKFALSQCLLIVKTEHTYSWIVSYYLHLNITTRRTVNNLIVIQSVHSHCAPSPPVLPLFLVLVHTDAARPQVHYHQQTADHRQGLERIKNKSSILKKITNLTALMK